MGEFSYDAVNECIGTINAENSEIMGNVKGDVCSVDGMDTSFMLCVRNKKNVDFYIQDNDITLRTGSDLYDNRTKMKGNIDSATYWLNFVKFYAPPRLNKEELLKLDRLIDMLCESPFMYADEKLIEKVYKEGEVCHLVVKTNVTTKTQISFNLSMVEGGYVFLSGFDSVCIKVDDPVFGELMDLLVGPYRREKKIVHTEKAELPFYKNEAGHYVAIDEQYEHAMIDWEGMFVYQGRLYKRSSLNYVEKKKAVGEHLGTATGDVGDDVEFSGNVEGEVYSINGVDPSFMLYVKLKNGSEFLYISGSDLALTTGANLYEGRTRMKGNIDSAWYSLNFVFF